MKFTSMILFHKDVKVSEIHLQVSEVYEKDVTSHVKYGNVLELLNRDTGIVHDEE